MNFFKEHKVKILMLSPLLVGILFFVFSAISAIYTVQTSTLPDDFRKVNLNITEYQIQQIDEENNSVKWVLKADEAEISSDQASARITNPRLRFFDAGKEKFTIDGDSAELDKINQEVVMENNVILKTIDGSIQISSNKMFFSEENPFVEFSDNWEILNDKGYLISGLEGKLSKDQDTIISSGNASLSKKSGDLNITADTITLKLKSNTPVQANSNSVLRIGNDKKLLANEIKISNSGAVNALGSVQVLTPNIKCFSSKMQIIPKANKEPKVAIFTGNPYVIQNSSKLYADTIRYDFDSGEAQLEGSVHSG